MVGEIEPDTGGLQPEDTWASGKAYEPYVGRWSRVVAEKFLQRLAIPPGSTWLDVGCGTGALTRTILEAAAPRSVVGIDAAEDYIAFVREQITDSRSTFLAGNAMDLPVDTAACDAVVSGLVLNFIPSPERAVLEMARAASPGGTVAAYVWDYAGGMQFMRHFWNAAAAQNPGAAVLDEGRRFPLCSPSALSKLFTGAGLSGVVVQPVDIWTVFRNFDDYWTPFLGGQGPAPSYTVSLSEDARAGLRERIRASLPFALDGSIPLAARAWAVMGVRQGDSNGSPPAS